MNFDKKLNKVLNESVDIKSAELYAFIINYVDIQKKSGAYEEWMGMKPAIREAYLNWKENMADDFAREHIDEIKASVSQKLGIDISDIEDDSWAWGEGEGAIETTSGTYSKEIEELNIIDLVQKLEQFIDHSISNPSIRNHPEYQDMNDQEFINTIINEWIDLLAPPRIRENETLKSVLLDQLKERGKYEYAIEFPDEPWRQDPNAWRLNEALGSLEDYEDFFGDYNDIIRMVKKGEISKERGEEIIKTNPYWAYLYADYVIKGRWPEGEEIIKTNPYWAYLYVRDVIKGRWPEGEDVIKTDPRWAYWYAFDVIQGRWPEGEEIIKTNRSIAESYFSLIRPDWIKVNEMAEQTGYSTSKVVNLIKRGIIEGEKFGVWYVNPRSYWLTIDQASERFGLSRQEILRMIRNDELEAVKERGKWYIPGDSKI